MTSKTESTLVHEIHFDDGKRVGFYRQHRGASSGNTYFYVSTSVNGKSRTGYVGKQLPPEATLEKMARSIVVPESEWNNRDKK